MTTLEAFINIVAAFGAIVLWMAIVTDNDKGSALPQSVAFAALLAFIVAFNTVM